MVLGTHVMDLMRFFAGNPQSCFAQCAKRRPAGDAQGCAGRGRGIGPLAGDEIVASYRFGGLTMGYFSTHRRSAWGIGAIWACDFWEQGRADDDAGRGAGGVVY